MENTALTGTETTAVWAGTAVWIGGITAALLLQLALQQVPSWLPATIAALAGAGMMLVAVVIARSALRREGVERTAGIEASALAFWITMGGVTTYGLVDSFADVPALRAPWVMFLGLICWCVAQASRLERYR